MAKYASLDSLRAIRDWAKEKFQSKLPEVTVQDNGDVLSVVDGEWSKSTPEKELPEVTSADNGKVLSVVAGEWEKAEAPDGLPPVQSADNGKVLTVVEGEWAKADVPDELPEVSASDNGKFLGVVNGAWGKAEVNALPAVTSQDNGKVLGVVEGQWAKTEPEDGLPEVTSSDNGKVLSVVEGAWAPAEPTGGSGLPEVTSEDNGDILSVVDGAWAKSEPGYRPAMVDGTVIVPEQTAEPQTDGTFYVARINDFNRDLVRGWLNNGTKPDSLPVTFNGVKYTAPTTQIETTSGGVTQFYCGEVDGEGVPVFTTYPFCVQFYKEVSEDETVWGVNLFTQSAGSFTIKIAEEVRTAIPTEDFKLAVNNSYMVSSEVDVVPEQTVEAADQDGFFVADLTNAALPSPAPETLSVTLNGTVYEAAAQFRGDDVMYGDQTLQSVPFVIGFFGSTSQILVSEAGSYTVHATGESESVNPKFQEAVKQSGGGMQTVMFEVYYDDSGEYTPEHIIVTCDKTIDELIAADGPLFAQAVLWQTNPPANAIAAAAFENYGSAYAEFQFLQFFTESPQELMYTTIFWNSGLEKWTVGFYEYGLTPLT